MSQSVIFKNRLSGCFLICCSVCVNEEYDV